MQNNSVPWQLKHLYMVTTHISRNIAEEMTCVLNSSHRLPLSFLIALTHSQPSSFLFCAFKQIGQSNGDSSFRNESCKKKGSTQPWGLFTSNMSTKFQFFTL